jgi:alanine dehydrogenase
MTRVLIARSLLRLQQHTRPYIVPIASRTLNQTSTQSHPTETTPPLRKFSTINTAIMSSNPIFKQGKTAVITGGASGIGLALASKLAGYGMSVVVIDNNSSNLSSAKSSIKGKVETIEMDVGKVEEFEKVKVRSLLVNSKIAFASLQIVKHYLLTIPYVLIDS